ncbi:NmrA family NAD(P)-binding protein [Nocardia wallacei]|uniref:NmrA family NAD(P)-binding protein n=1 Tax=Nocardia wallacei TaxID=480035 RepID=UPI0024568CE1|nr:NmrA family NAD(P)-binding protein [Nocardia wallacei]
MIVVTTPTGSIGHQVLAAVLDSGRPVRVIARDPARLPERARAEAEIVRGSMADSGVVADAFTGADSVFWVVPPDPRAESIAGHVIEFTRPLCDVIATKRIERVVAVSSLGRATARNAGQISAIFAMDHLVESTGVHYRSLCPPGFMENLLRQVATIRDQGVFFGPTAGDRRAPQCSTRDIAAVAAELLLDNSWTGQSSVPILGPADLSSDEMAEIVSEVLGRPVRYQQVDPDAFKANLTGNGLSDAWAQGLLDMANAVDQGIYDAEAALDEYRTPTGFRQWCEEVLEPAVAA